MTRRPRLALGSLAFCAATLLGIAPASAIVLYGVDNNGNRTAPVDGPAAGAPFNSVGQAYFGPGGTGPLVGTVTYVGNRFTLSESSTLAVYSVVFPGQEPIDTDLSFERTTIGRFIIHRLQRDPGVPAVPLARDFGLESGVLIGGGGGRDPSVPVNTSVVPWAKDLRATAAVRWGLSSIFNFCPDYICQPKSVFYLSAFDRLGPDWSGPSQMDNGAGFFIKQGDQWLLAGVSPRPTAGQSTFTDSGGDTSVFWGTPPSVDAINAIITAPNGGSEPPPPFIGLPCFLGLIPLVAPLLLLAWRRKGR